jgi:hypothetical protein
MPGVRASRQRPAPPELLAKPGNGGRPVDRDESGTIAEVCPFHVSRSEFRDSRASITRPLQLSHHGELINGDPRTRQRSFPKPRPAAARTQAPQHERDLKQRKESVT